MHGSKKINIALTIITIGIIIWAEIWYQKGIFTTNDKDIINTRFVITISLMTSITVIRWLKYFNNNKQG